MTTVRVNLGPRTYEVVVTGDDGPGPFVRRSVTGTLAVIVTDKNVVPHLARITASFESAGFRTAEVVLPAGEAHKTLTVVATLYDRLAELRADRKTLVVAVGGGVVGDVAGFAAATYNRGLPLLMIPTTLLAMVDSSVGGKVGVNHARGKNLIGAFHQPAGVWIDTGFLDTLPRREFRSGLAEVVKYGVILDAEFFAYLESHTRQILDRQADAITHIVARSCRLKADVVEQDEREETGRRAVLNYGHTFAHAFETIAGYGSWLHGEAVAAGMVCASRLAERHGLIDAEVTARQLRLLQAFGLPTAPLAWPADDLLNAMRSDKKNQAGRLRFVLPRRLGEVALFDDVAETDVRAVLQESLG